MISFVLACTGWITPRIGVETNLYCCPYRTVSPSLSTALIRLSLSHTITLFVYRAYISVFVARSCPPCLPPEYLCPCLTLLFSLSTAQICLSLSHASALLV